MAYLLRYKSCLPNKVCGKLGEASGLYHVAKGNVTVDEMKASDQEVIKAVQKKFFPEEVMQPIKDNQDNDPTAKPVNKSSSIRRLDPMMRDGLLRVGGRLRHANIGAEAKNPIILPKEDHVVNLIVKHYHERFGHILSTF